jgi:hypothetical protein
LLITHDHSDGLPVAWWNAEMSAQDVLTSRSTTLAVATFEFRAARDVLALTILLAGLSGPSAGEGRFSDDDAYVLQERLRSDEAWIDWILTALAEPGSPRHIGHTDLRAAQSAWLWLTRSRILGCPSPSRRITMSDSPACKGSGLCAGLRLARRIVAN